MAKAAKMIKVEQIGSAIRRHHSQRETLIGLKLNKIGRTTELQDTPAIRGMIAGKIVAHGADYLLALKGNQPTLEADVADYFRTAPTGELVTKSSE